MPNAHESRSLFRALTSHVDAALAGADAVLGVGPDLPRIYRGEDRWIFVLTHVADLLAATDDRAVRFIADGRAIVARRLPGDLIVAHACSEAATRSRARLAVVALSLAAACAPLEAEVDEDDEVVAVAVDDAAAAAVTGGDGEGGEGGEEEPSMPGPFEPQIDPQPEDGPWSPCVVMPDCSGTQECIAFGWAKGESPVEPPSQIPPEPEHYEIEAGFCTDVCQTADDCAPAPASDGAFVACRNIYDDVGLCVLGCIYTSQCPQDMTCTNVYLGAGETIGICL